MDEIATWRDKRIATIVTTYKVTIERAIELLEVEKCQACGLQPASVVDHDHHTGRVRGFICRSCNARFVEEYDAGRAQEQAIAWANIAA